MKDSDILGEPITGVRYNDRTYTFYPYAGRMVSPKGGLLGFIKTAKGKLHGRFYTKGQWFLFEPAPEGNEPILAHYTVEEVVNKLLETPTTFPLVELKRMAQQWFKLNAFKLHDERWELALTFYRDQSGKLLTTNLERGDVAEVEFPEPPPGSDIVGSLHTHVGCIGEFSEYDMAEGQKMANQLGHSYYMCVIGPSDEDDESMMFSEEVFEPEHAVDPDADVDPKAYAMTLRRKRDIVQELVKKYAVRHTWQDYNRLLITFPKDVRFGIALHNANVPPASSIGVSGGSKNNRMLYLWNEGDLDTLI